MWDSATLPFDPTGTMAAWAKIWRYRERRAMPRPVPQATATGCQTMIIPGRVLCAGLRGPGNRRCRRPTACSRWHWRQRLFRMAPCGDGDGGPCAARHSRSRSGCGGRLSSTGSRPGMHRAAEPLELAEWRNRVGGADAYPFVGGHAESDQVGVEHGQTDHEAHGEEQEDGKRQGDRRVREDYCPGRRGICRNRIRALADIVNAMDFRTRRRPGSASLNDQRHVNNADGNGEQLRAAYSGGGAGGGGEREPLEGSTYR